jgi:nucleotide-binding universal stress UspA family protein
MRSILVNADRKPDSEARIDAALELARHLNGHITVLVDTPVSRYIAMDPMGGSYVISEALDRARGEDDAAAEAIEARLTRGDVAFDIVRSEQDPVPALAGAARLSDLVVETTLRRICVSA